MLEIADLACSRGGYPLFRGLHAQVGQGEVLRVQGPNGAGKTSLLRLICGLSMPLEGEVRWQGQPIAALRENYGRQLIYLGHAAALKDDLSACENLRTACLLGGIAVSADAVMQALAASGLQGREHLPARVLSQGQRRRAALARLVLARIIPSDGQPLWVLDEPFNALDAAGTAWLLGLIRAHLQGGGIVVLTSHQPALLGSAVREVALAL